MSVIVFGISHRTASLELLERVAIEPAAVAKLRAAVLDSPHVSEAIVLATCNRIEIYAATDRFHGSVDDLTELFADHSGVEADVWLPAVYVRYDEAAIAHLFSVATGLDSMVVGEGQILGQMKTALRSGQDAESVGPRLNGLFQQALRVGKRAHAETGIDRVGASLVTVALDEAERLGGPLAGRQVSVIGAGSMAALAAATLRAHGVADLTIVNRSPVRGTKVGAKVAARYVPLSELGAELERNDLVFSCTGAVGVLVTVEAVTSAAKRRIAPLTVVDLAVPHDVEPAVAEVEGVTLIGMSRIAELASRTPSQVDEQAVRSIVAEEVAAYRLAADRASVGPTVAALRSMASAVVSAELDRLWRRVDTPSERDRVEVEQTIRRVADKLLHEPTVRVKQLGGQVPADSYARALADLFALDPAAVAAVTRPGDSP